MKKKYALNLPPHSIRAIITLTLVLAVIGLGFLIISMINKLTTENFKLAFSVFTAIIALTSMMLGAYISKK